jgi:cobalt/nickel transport protein
MQRRNLWLMVGVVALAVLPLAIHLPGTRTDFGGSDDQAGEMVEKLRPGYQPWFHALWKPPSDEVESLLFAVQAAIGAGFVCYWLGWSRGRTDGRKGREDAGA